MQDMIVKTRTAQLLHQADGQTDDNGDLERIMQDLGEAARAAAKKLAMADEAQKNEALIAMAEALKAQSDQILAANQRDMEAAEATKISGAFLDRLKLDEARIGAMADGIAAIAALPDPVGAVIAEWQRPNGLKIERVRIPLGVIGVIFESRPNVTADAGALCLKSGNAAILRGGSDSFFSSNAIHVCLAKGLEKVGLPKQAIQIVPTTDRAAVGQMLKGLGGNLDVIVPRGGKSLVERVQNEARVPVFAHLEGLCHIYVDKSAQAKMAAEVSVNAKMRRTGICGAAETLLIDKALDHKIAINILTALDKAGCQIRGSEEIIALYPEAKKAEEADWRTEYVDAIISVKMVDGVTGAIEHINHYSSNHTEAILAEDEAAVARFFNEIDSAILLHNASTQFADGGEFGMGAEIGIATGKMHARGPVGVEQLTSFKYLVRGSGQSRP